LNFISPAEGTAIFHAERGKFLVPRDRSKARAELERSIAISPQADAIAVLLNLLLRTGELNEAQKLVDQVEASDNKQCRLIPSIEKKLIEAGVRISIKK
jgi:hypothetical protein